MERRKAIKLAAGAVAAGGVGVVALTTAFKPKVQPAAEPQQLACEEEGSSWAYTRLDPAGTARRAYNDYSKGSCMFGVFNSIISQLAEKIGEPFSSFPTQMMKYGHGGIGGYGTVCGALNGAAALIGLLLKEKEVQNVLIADLFMWYEKSPFPLFKPEKAILDFTPPASVSESVLCHASTTNWGKTAGYTIGSKERKERCRRLTADVAAQTVTILNKYFENTFLSHARDNETVRTCMTCHGSEGKLGNTSGNMNCTSCHDESLAHKLFADPHYKLMDKR